jgi:hypothetical protein
MNARQLLESSPPVPDRPVAASIAAMDLLALVGLGLFTVLVVILLSGIRFSAFFSSLPGPLWSIPLLGEVIEFQDSPIDFMWRR